jgi:hypothetical protein
MRDLLEEIPRGQNIVSLSRTPKFNYAYKEATSHMFTLQKEDYN